MFQTLEEMNEFLIDLNKTTTKPFIVVIGDSTSFIFTDFYLYHNGQLLKLDNFLQAVNIWFKSFAVFNLPFPMEAYGIFSFLDSVVFELKRHPLNSGGSVVTSYLYSLIEREKVH